MGKVIGWIEHIAILGALSIALWTGVELIKAFAGWWPSVIFAGCIVVLAILPSREARDD